MRLALTVLSENPHPKIDIYLDSFPCAPPLALQAWQRVTRLAEDKSIQIRSLIVKVDRESMRSLLPHLPNHPLPRLEELELVVVDGQDYISSMDDFIPEIPSDHPPLYSLKLEVIAIPLENTIFNGLRKLELIWLSLPLPTTDSFLDVLDRCTGLEILVLDSSPPLLVEKVDCPNHYRTVELSHLKTFRVSDDRVEQIVHLLLHLSLPPTTTIGLEWVVEDDWNWNHFFEDLPALSLALQVLGVVEWLDVKFTGGDYSDAYIKAGRDTLGLRPPLLLISLEGEGEQPKSVGFEIVMLSFPHLFSSSTQLRHLNVTCDDQFLSLEIWADALTAFPYITTLDYSSISSYIENLGPTEEELRQFFASPQVATLCPRLSTVNILVHVLHGCD
ncbi:hypothetical protein NLI96_g5 [Meripilus lineatus]|uniref:F-box domain-containing protein n=1 Tax=Meripilus lineatus TaxID=2056292 RepID=A0AAD5YJQ5_9APHY|nr:hypothetical protein NLI96_g5 [Physisporinus lineatus]